MQMKANSEAAASASVGLNIQKGKKARSPNTTQRTSAQSQLLEKLWKTWKLFKRLNSIIDEREGSDADINERIGESRAAFLKLKIWNSKQLSTKIKQFCCTELKLRGLSRTDLNEECWWAAYTLP
ncbi:unnamed protein product [Schistosoma margrebowiei]|uniref:Uncharacterized protein n=1 Tax=Schistosoma margrebowiei TaxID=48269 RepID=A0A183LWF7_9TREM|nr:unnamed protein product [Schistosoma margrebowiei]